MRLITRKELRALHIATRHHHTINSRLAILRYAEEYGFKGAARRFGLDRKTVRTWHRRWAASGPTGLVPRHPLTRRRKLSEETVRLIEQARRDLQFGAMRTRIWLERVHRIRVATATIRRICRDLGYPPVRRTEPRRSRHPILFSKEHPGDCVQVDVKEVKVAGQKCFQYTALDDCTRYRVLRLYPRKYHGTSLDFLATVRQTLPFPIRKVQVDNGTEFPLTFALAVQEAGIRLRYIKPRRPEQNGKVERSHRIDEEEFWSRSTFDGFASAAQALTAWEHRYNYDRFSMALSGLTPAEKLATFKAASPLLSSNTVSPNPLPAPTSAMDRPPIVAPESTMHDVLSHNYDRNSGATA
jgi:transposase InsO family protein